jgi:glycosyltransferase involved in cell wall biosynthesis
MPIITKIKKEFIQRCFHQESIPGPILEIGSGRDKFNRALFSKKYKVITTNIYPKNVVNYICSVNCLSFEDNKFGCVICEHVLEHVENPARAIDEIKRVLKPNGLLILTAPFSWSIHEKPYDLWRFSEEGLRYLIVNKFESVKFEAIGPPKKPALICITARKPIHEKSKIKHPKVSVIMPTYNRAHMISKSIESVLSQTFKDWELIIVNDGSTDNTKEVVAKYNDPRIVYLEKENGGPSSARNLGLRYAKGEYITYCDDDNIIFPYHLETLYGYLDRHPEIGLVRANAVKIIKPKKIGYLGRGLLWASMHKHNLLKKVGFFDTRLDRCQDVDFLIRLHDYCNVKILECILTKHIIHSGNISFEIAHNDPAAHWKDLIYVKRVRKIFGVQRIKKPYFIMAASIFHERNLFKTMLALSKIFYSRYPCIHSAYLTGLSYYRVGNISKSIEYMKKVVNYGSRQYKTTSRENLKTKEFAFALLGILYARKKQHGLSIKYLRQGLNIYPKGALLIIELFHASLESGRKDLAQELLVKNKAKVISSYMRGVLFLYQKECLKAKEYLERAYDIDKILKYRLCSSLSRLYSIMGREDYAKKHRVRSWAYEKETYFNILLSKKLLEIDLSYMRKLTERIFLRGDNTRKRII